MRTVTRRVTRGVIALSAGVVPVVAAPAPAHAANNVDYQCDFTPSAHCAEALITCYGRSCNFFAYGGGNASLPPNSIVVRLTAFGPNWSVLYQETKVCDDNYCETFFDTTVGAGGTYTTCTNVWIQGQQSDAVTACASLSVK